MYVDYKAQWEMEFDKWLLEKRDESIFKLLIGKEIYLYGAGHIGKCVSDMLEENNIEIKGILDSNEQKWGTLVYGKYICRSLDDVEVCNNTVILVTSSKGYREIFESHSKYRNILFNPGFSMASKISYIKENLYECSLEKCKQIREKVSAVFDLLENEESKRTYFQVCKSMFLSKLGETLYEEAYTELPEYFFDEFMKSKVCDKFIDCGAFDGDTFELYYEYMNGMFDKAYLFEMDEDMYNILVSNIENKFGNIKEKIKCINAGVSDENSTALTSIVSENGMWKIDNAGYKHATLVTLDEAVKEEVNFIKMDIEGAELSAIIGAKNIIAKQKPNLAVCIYHKPNDLWEIPMMIKELNPSYRLYIKHHSFYCQDTILYAVNGD